MSDELEADELAALLPEVVRKAYAAEQEFIDNQVESINNVGENGWAGYFRAGTEWIPYVGDIFIEEPKGPAAATSGVNREARFRSMVDTIESGLGEKLDEQTKKNIRADLEAMYNGKDTDE